METLTEVSPKKNMVQKVYLHIMLWFDGATFQFKFDRVEYFKQFNLWKF